MSSDQLKTVSAAEWAAEAGISPSAKIRRARLDAHRGELLDLAQAGFSQRDQRTYLERRYGLIVSQQNISSWWQRQAARAERLAGMSTVRRVRPGAVPGVVAPTVGLADPPAGARSSVAAAPSPEPEADSSSPQTAAEAALVGVEAARRQMLDGGVSIWGRKKSRPGA